MAQVMFKQKNGNLGLLTPEPTIAMTDGLSNGKEDCPVLIIGNALVAIPYEEIADVISLLASHMKVH